MTDTDFGVPEAKRDRLAVLHAGADPSDPAKPGLLRVDDQPYAGAYTRKVTRESGGGGLVCILGDMVRLLQSLMPGGATLLRPETIALMFQNQLPPELCVRFPGRLPFLHRGFALGSAFARRAGPGDPAEVADEVSWGGVAGTIWTRRSFRDEGTRISAGRRLLSHAKEGIA